MASYTNKIKEWALIYTDTFVNESKEQDANIDEAIPLLTYDANYLAAVKDELKDLLSTNKFAYDMAVKYITMNKGKPARISPEEFAQLRRALAAAPSNKKPELSRADVLAQAGATRKSDFDKVQKAEIERKNPHNIVSIWVKSMSINPVNETKSFAVVEFTYKDGKKSEDKIDVGTSGTSGGFENADRLYKQIKRNFAISGKKATDVDIRLAILRVSFSDPLITWFYGKSRAMDSQWAFNKEIKKLNSDPVIKKARKEKEEARSVVYKNGNTTIYRTEGEELEESSPLELAHIPQKQKDEALSQIIEAVSEYFQQTSDADEVLTTIARTIEDYRLDPRAF